MKTTVGLGLLLWCMGCHRAAHSPFPEPPLQPQPARARAPTVILNTNIHGPIKYRWTFTNGPDGAKVLRFTPGN